MHPDPKRLDEDVTSYPAVQLARQSRGLGSVVANNRAGISRLFVYRAMQNPSILGQQPWVLLTEVDREEELVGLRKLRRELLLGVVLVLIGSSRQRRVLVSMTQPVHALGAFAKRIGTGDLCPARCHRRARRGRAAGGVAQLNGRRAAGARPRQGSVRALHRDTGVGHNS